MVELSMAKWVVLRPGELWSSPRALATMVESPMASTLTQNLESGWWTLETLRSVEASVGESLWRVERMAGQEMEGELRVEMLTSTRMDEVEVTGVSTPKWVRRSERVEAGVEVSVAWVWVGQRVELERWRAKVVQGKAPCTSWTS